MRIPPVFTLFCLLVLGSFGYAKYRGLDLIPSGGNALSGSGGSHTSGIYAGSHK